MKYTDMQILEYLEVHDIPSDYSHFLQYKDKLNNGEIEFSDIPAPSTVQDEVEKELEKEEKAPEVSEADLTQKKYELGSMIKVSRPHVNFSEATLLSSRKGDRLLESYLTEDCGMSQADFDSLTEEVKTEGMMEVIKSLITQIQEKVLTVDTSIADRSRGDIKQIRELPVIQDSVNKLEEVFERYEGIKPEHKQALNTIIQSILYINQYSSVFKDAYRNKKTILIMKYQSLILSIVSSLSYMISTVLDFRAGTLKVRNFNEDIYNFAPLKSLKAFVASVESGEFKSAISDVNIVREYYLEMPVDVMSNILEAGEVVPALVDGLKNLFGSVSSNNKVMNLLYKAAGFIVILFSLRDTFYTMFRMKTKVSDIVGSLQNFCGINDGGNVFSKLYQFTNKFRGDSQMASDLSTREIEDQDRSMGKTMKTFQAATNSMSSPVFDMGTVTPQDSAPEMDSEPSQAASTPDLGSLIDF